MGYERWCAEASTRHRLLGEAGRCWENAEARWQSLERQPEVVLLRPDVRSRNTWTLSAHYGSHWKVLSKPVLWKANFLASRRWVQRRQSLVVRRGGNLDSCWGNKGPDGQRSEVGLVMTTEGKKQMTHGFVSWVTKLRGKQKQTGFWRGNWQSRLRSKWVFGFCQ